VNGVKGIGAGPRAADAGAQPTGADRFAAVVDLAARRGFFQPSAQIYGGLAGFFDYGPAGAVMLRKMQQSFIDYWTHREQFMLVDTPTVGPERVFRASGHLEKFHDPLVECLACGEASRQDHVQNASGELNPCPNCGKTQWSEPRQASLMFATQVGASRPLTVYLRPETAQGIFWNFAQLLRQSRGRVPFGVVQVGLGYRNEIAPRQALFRMREFHMGEVEVFMSPGDKAWPRFSELGGAQALFLSSDGAQHLATFGEMARQGTVRSEALAHFMAATLEVVLGWGMDPDRVRFRQHMPDEMAHYAADSWDLEVETSLGWIECVGIADRGSYDLTRHQEYSGADLSVFVPYDEPKEVEADVIVPDFKALGPQFRKDAVAVGEAMKAASPRQVGPDGNLTVEVAGQKVTVDKMLFRRERRTVKKTGDTFVPHVIEPSFGFDRIFFALLDAAYRRVEKEGEPYTILGLSPSVAPVTVSVFPLMAKDGLDDRALAIHHAMHASGIDSAYDASGSIGKRYARADEVGTPWCVTVDYDSLEDKAATLRHRDTQVQERVPMADLPARVLQLMRRPAGGVP
jgi:glycyl-tRNA synthetase